MGPTCSIIYENEPMEKNTLLQAPRPFTSTFFNWRELTTSMIQGLFITAGTLFTYQLAVKQAYDIETTRTMVFSTLIFANIFLTLINRSFYYSIFSTLFYKNNWIYGIIIATLILLAALIYIEPFALFFGFKPLAIANIGHCIWIGAASVLWYEIVKWIKRLSSNQRRLLASTLEGVSLPLMIPLALNAIERIICVIFGISIVLNSSDAL